MTYVPYHRHHHTATNRKCMVVRTAQSDNLDRISSFRSTRPICRVRTNSAFYISVLLTKCTLFSSPDRKEDVTHSANIRHVAWSAVLHYRPLRPTILYGGTEGLKGINGDMLGLTKRLQKSNMNMPVSIWGTTHLKPHFQLQYRYTTPFSANLNIYDFFFSLTEITTAG